MKSFHRSLRKYKKPNGKIGKITTGKFTGEIKSVKKYEGKKMLISDQINDKTANISSNTHQV